MIRGPRSLVTKQQPARNHQLRKTPWINPIRLMDSGIQPDVTKCFDARGFVHVFVGVEIEFELSRAVLIHCTVVIDEGYSEL
jgi:hypothetical protein